jgi:hypothetical protein
VSNVRGPSERLVKGILGLPQGKLDSVREGRVGSNLIAF